MSNICKHCHHWQGTKEVLYGDCYMIIGELIPNFFNCFNDLGCGFSIPFDPHEAVKYYSNSVTFKKLYSKLFATELDGAVKKDIILTKDLVFDLYGRSYLKNVKLLFLQTRKGYHCNYFERKEE